MASILDNIHGNHTHMTCPYMGHMSISGGHMSKYYDHMSGENGLKNIPPAKKGPSATKKLPIRHFFPDKTMNHKTMTQT